MRRCVSSVSALLVWSCIAAAAGCGSSSKRSDSNSAGGAGDGSGGDDSNGGDVGNGGASAGSAGVPSGSGGNGQAAAGGPPSGSGGSDAGGTAGEPPVGSGGSVTAGSGGQAGGTGGASSGGTAGQSLGGAAGGPLTGVGGQTPGGTGGQGTGGSAGAVDPPDQPTSPYIVVDQFGYLPDSEKIAVLRDPQTGYDAAESFAPGSNYALIDARSGTEVLSGAPTAWNGGAEDTSSGDRAWWFDFSSVTAPGTYYVLDVDQDVRSVIFDISESVYAEVLRHAVRTFYYQRAGQEKLAAHAGEGWTDGPSHVGPLQDANCRLYSASDDATTERDLSGGWYDAGDFNKYTNWHASYVVALLHTYDERPGIWPDNWSLPESGNGIPDLVDEIKWGLDWLIKMQNSDGSVLSIVGLAAGSPPSSVTDQSLYGPENTSATLSTAGAFAYGSKVFRSVGDSTLTAYADDLLARAENAWAWADANPSVTFQNNDSSSGSSGLGAGQQEMDDHGRLMRKLTAAIHLFEETGTAAYRDFFDSNYLSINMMDWGYVYPFETNEQSMALYYTTVPGHTQSVADDILQTYRDAMLNGGNNFPALDSEADPYLAHMADYVWGSNSTKSGKGLMFADMITYDVDPASEADAARAAARYAHYVHGVNPLGIVYLSNMYGAGAENSVNEFYHSWFTDGSAAWDRVGTSTYGPPPGFLTGGPNPSYDWADCCPDGCGSADNNAICTSESLEPPRGQPDQKAYKDFNTNWPLNSWEVTENSNGYQVQYVRLLSKFVP